MARARAEPGVLALGIDADASRMAVAASRAARKPARGGVANARFLVCAAEALPAELGCSADLVTITFPWGSLLRGVVTGDPAVVLPIVDLLKPSGAALRLLLSVEQRDGSLGVPVLDVRAMADVAARLEDIGLVVTATRSATAADLAAGHSTWARRLGIGRGDRRAWLLTARRGPGEGRRMNGAGR